MSEKPTDIRWELNPAWISGYDSPFPSRQFDQGMFLTRNECQCLGLVDDIGGSLPSDDQTDNSHPARF
jgi:hypothetical protein